MTSGTALPLFSPKQQNRSAVENLQATQDRLTPPATLSDYALAVARAKSYRLLWIFTSLSIGLWYCWPLLSTLGHPASPSPLEALREEAVISLSSYPTRYGHELPTALDSLLRQSLAPRDIRLYLPLGSEQLAEATIGQRFQQPIGDGILKVNFVEDVGPTNKYTFVLSELLASQDLDRPVIILDDDHAYAPTMLACLLAGHINEPCASLGFRGWRVRRDLRWGVAGEEEYRRHVVSGDRLKEPYRVSVLTANKGYLVLPRFFNTNLTFHKLKSGTRKGKPELLVDDIYMAGMLAEHEVPRIVVPCDEASLNVTHVHPLESHLSADGFSRGDANKAALHQFRAAWKKEELWYVFLKDALKGKHGSGQGVSDDPVEVGILLSCFRWLRRARGRLVVWSKFPYVTFV